LTTLISEKDVKMKAVEYDKGKNPPAGNIN
jgi:hypothetical protein